MKPDIGQRWVYNRGNIFIAECVALNDDHYHKWKIVQKIHGGGWYAVGEIFTMEIDPDWSYLEGQDKP